jgi:anti-sigma regulatory factor (Ser/Thr protein kinase)
MEIVTYPATAASPAAARRMVRGALAGSSADTIEVVVLLTSELVTNVVRHAGTEVRVTVEVGPPIRVEVHDRAAITTALRRMIATRPGPGAVRADGGRGLTLVHDLASRLGLHDDPAGGKAVWFEFDVPGAV